MACFCHNPHGIWRQIYWRRMRKGHAVLHHLSVLVWCLSLPASLSPPGTSPHPPCSPPVTFPVRPARPVHTKAPPPSRLVNCPAATFTPPSLGLPDQSFGLTLSRLSICINLACIRWPAQLAWQLLIGQTGVTSFVVAGRPGGLMNCPLQICYLNLINEEQSGGRQRLTAFHSQLTARHQILCDVNWLLWTMPDRPTVE